MKMNMFGQVNYALRWVLYSEVVASPVHVHCLTAKRWVVFSVLIQSNNKSKTIFNTAIMATILSFHKINHKGTTSVQSVRQRKQTKLNTHTHTHT